MDILAITLHLLVIILPASFLHPSHSYAGILRLAEMNLVTHTISESVRLDWFVHCS